MHRQLGSALQPAVHCCSRLQAKDLWALCEGVSSWVLVVSFCLQINRRAGEKVQGQRADAEKMVGDSRSEGTRERSTLHVTR